MKKNLIVLTTGGTGGHIFPAASLALELQKAGYRIAFITDKRAKNIPDVLSDVHYIVAEGVTGRSFLRKIGAAFKLLFGTIQAGFLLIKLQPKAVVAFGGYACVPTGLAAQFLHFPVMLHEQNAVLGRANRLLARRTKLIATSFTPTALIPGNVPTVETGMPVRPPILEKANCPYPDQGADFHLLIIGGSQGARAFSSVIPEALNVLPPYLKARLILTQQVRAEDMEKVREAYRNSGIKTVTLSPFFNNIAELLEQAHLVISRAGSSSLAEFSVMGKPALLIPLPTAADDHQTANARSFTQSGGGWLMIEKDFTPEALATRLCELMENPAVLKKASELARQKASLNASKELCRTIISHLKKGKK